MAQNQQEAGQALGRIVAGMPITEEVRLRAEERFSKLLGKPVHLECIVDERQLAGICVEINGYSYDGTLRGQLTNLYKALSRPDKEDGQLE